MGDCRPDAAQTLNHMAAVYKNQGKHELAIENCSMTLEILTCNFGDRHPDVAQTLNHVAGALRALLKSREGATSCCSESGLQYDCRL